MPAGGSQTIGTTMTAARMGSAPTYVTPSRQRGADPNPRAGHIPNVCGNGIAGNVGQNCWTLSIEVPEFEWVASA